MKTKESINQEYNEQQRRNFKTGLYSAVLGITIGLTGFARNYYQSENIPGMYPLSKPNLAIAVAGIGIGITSVFAPMALNLRAKRKRDSELESISDSNANEDIDLPFMP
jgi:hypothetical protein